MTSVRSAKSKGSQFEYDCQASLEQAFTNVFRTAERGYQRQYDLEIRKATLGQETVAIFECKRLKGISWNQLEAFFKKLHSKRQVPSINAYILFKSNFQPCLVFYMHNYKYIISPFEDVFGVPFIKHESTRSKR